MNRKSIPVFLLIILFNTYSNNTDCSILQFARQNDTTIIKGRLLYFADSSAMPGVMILVNSDKEFFSTDEGRFEIALNHLVIDSIKIEALGCRAVTFINIPQKKIIDLESILLFDAVDSPIIVYADIPWRQFHSRKKAKQVAQKERIELIENVNRSLATYRYKNKNQNYKFDVNTNKIDLANPIKQTN